MNEDFTMKEFKEALQKRIAFVNSMIEIGKIRTEEPFNKEHWTGYLAALDGTVGELQFLKKLYERIK